MRRWTPQLQNLLQRVVRFFHPRLSCPTHISADVCGGRKSLVKPVTRQNISSCSVLSPEIVMHDDAYIGGRSENNIKCVVHDNLGWKYWTARYIMLRHWLYGWFSQFHRCGTYSVLSRSHSIEENLTKLEEAVQGGSQRWEEECCVSETIYQEMKTSLNEQNIAVIHRKWTPLPMWASGIIGSSYGPW